MPLRQAIEDMTVAPLFIHEEGSEVPAIVWNGDALARVRRAAERLATWLEVAAGQNRFRMGYAACVVLGEEEAKATCPHVKEAHFHGRVRRIGHLPMFTIKELPE